MSCAKTAVSTTEPLGRHLEALGCHFGALKRLFPKRSLRVWGAPLIQKELVKVAPKASDPRKRVLTGFDGVFDGV